MKILSSFITLLSFSGIIVSCSGDTQDIRPVIVSRSMDSVKNVWQKPHEAILRVHLDSEEATDLLTSVSITYGEGFCLSAKVDQMLTHPFQRDFTVVPHECQAEINVVVRMNGEKHTLRTLVPHLRSDYCTQLNLGYTGSELRVTSCWTEECTTGAAEAVLGEDTVRVGHYLSTEGIITSSLLGNSVAVVVETDGRHGKAVALEDVEGEWVFSSMGVSTGLLFGSLDGKTCEGLLNKKRTEADSLSRLFYCASLPYPDSCAFSQPDGYMLCSRLLSQSKCHVLQSNDMLNVCNIRNGIYVPSVPEMVALYNLINGYGQESLQCARFRPLKGAYLTSTESSFHTFYSMDFSQGALSGYTSKRYLPLRLRVFYLF